MNPMTNNGNFMENVFQKVEKGKCRIAWNGQIAVWTSGGYKTFNSRTGVLTNCDNFVAQLGDDFFYVVPATRVKVGDIILVNGTPRCVMKADKNMLTVMTYETGSIENIIPERHMFMGNVFFYRKITAPMLGMFTGGKGGANRMIRMMMLGDMMKGNGGNAGGDNNPMAGGMNLMQLMMMQGMMKDMDTSMDEMFNLFEDEEDEEEAPDAE